jgi:hypothetical protein
VEHSEGKGGERAVNILRFQGGSPRVVLAPVGKL